APACSTTVSAADGPSSPGPAGSLLHAANGVRASAITTSSGESERRRMTMIRAIPRAPSARHRCACCGRSRRASPDPMSEIPADERVPYNRRIFCNRNLRLDRIRFVGFDMDYTLAIYEEAMEHLQAE